MTLAFGVIQRGMACVFATCLVLSACGPGLPVPIGPGPDVRLHQQAQAALARWAEAVRNADQQGLVFVGELTGQVGDWEETVGDNNKPALQAGEVRAVVSLPADTPPPAEVRWPDGTSKTVDVVSAAQALDDIVKSAPATCPECRPLEITGAALENESVQTSRGPAIAPTW